MRAARVFRQPGTHMLLIGIGGTGKKSCIQMASYMQRCVFIQPVLTRNYTLADFNNDLKAALLTAGNEGHKVVFFLNEQNIVKVSLF